MNNAIVDSFTMASGWASLFNGFGGKNSEKITYNAFLPFQPDEGKGSRRISKNTASIFLSLMDSKRLPMRVIGAASSLLQEMRKAASE